MSAEPLDRQRVEEVCTEILRVIQANYLRGPISRDRVLEALNALAIATAFVIKGADDANGEARRFFAKALEQQLREG